MATAALRLYRYVFYKLYRMETALLDPIPAFTAFVLMVALQGLNVALLLVLAEAITGIKFMHYLWNNEGLLLVVIVGLLQYLALIHRGRLKSILQEFSDEPMPQRRRGTIGVTLYVVLSFVVYVVCAVLIGRAIYG
jgi:hypothetical protein